MVSRRTDPFAREVPVMLFRKEIEPYCAYCARGTRLNEGEILCIKRGIVTPDYHCSAFRYEPLKRVPPKPPKLELGSLDSEDFSLSD